MKSTWLQVSLREIVTPVSRPVNVTAGTSYRTIGVKWWGEGAYERVTIDGSQTAAKTLSLVREGDFIINKIWVRHGSAAIASSAVDGCAASGEFPTFELDSNQVLPRWLHWQTKTQTFWNKCASLSQGTSGKNRIKPDLFLTIEIPLPPLPEQQRIVARIEELAAKITEAHRLREEIENDRETLLSAAFRSIAENAPRKLMKEVAPLERRPATIDLKQSYPQIAVRSFGRGVFHKPALAGSDITWQKPYLVKAGDILISNIKAWEGAIAVTTSEDDGRVGSHRYLTCVPIPEVATARFVCFYLLSPEGLHKIGEASPGSADRNRTLNTKALLHIPILVPPLKAQVWFDQLCHYMDDLKHLQTETAAELDALLPAVLHKAFKGEL